MNYGQVVTNLGVLDPALNQYAQSRGMVMTVNDFEGEVEFINNTVKHNMAFIPSAVLANSQKFNKSAFSPTTS